MRPLPMVALLFSAFLIQHVMADDKLHPHKTVSEATVRMISDMTYAELLCQAANKGWRYTAEQINSGRKRHFEEFKLQLVNHGYEIIVDDADI